MMKEDKAVLPENLNNPLAINILRLAGLATGFICTIVFITTVSILCGVV